MSYRVEQEEGGTTAIVVEGFENGIATSPHKGIANMQGVNIATESGEAMCSFNRVKQSQVGTSGTLTQVNTNTVSVSEITLKVGQIITITDAGTTGLLNSSASTIAILAVGGGGGGGYNAGGGGGGGGYQYNTTLAVTNIAYSVTIGAGGAGGTIAQRGQNGTNTTFGALVTATGGGGGGSRDSGQLTGANGGSGGGGAGATDQGASTGGTGSQGFNGGDGLHAGAFSGGGGGGGTGVIGGTAVGTVAGSGGNGTSNSISGSSVTYAGGGGGGLGSATGTPGSGGTGGGGNAPVVTNVGNPGTANTGGGGSGGSGANGGAGGSGIVIISYPTVGTDVIITATGGTITTSGGNTIHTFTTSGTFTITNIALLNPNYYYLSTGKLYHGSLPPSDPDSVTAVTGITSGTATFSITYPLGQPIQSATEPYYRDLTQTIYYRYYILDSLGQVWCHDSYTLVNWDTPAWFFIGTGLTGSSGLAVYNGWITISNGTTHTYWKLTSLFGSDWYDSSITTQNHIPIIFFSNTNHVMLSGTQGKLYGTDGRYITSLFANSSLISGVANIQSYLKYTPSALGANSVTNGTFTGSAAGWTLETGWGYGSNNVVHSSDGTGELSQSATTLTFRVYKITFTISNWSVGSVTPSLGTRNGTAVSANGTYSQYIDTNTEGGGSNLTFTPTNTARFTIDTITMELVGTTATTTVIGGSSPTTGIVSGASIPRIPAVFFTDGTLPTGITANTIYYIEWFSQSNFNIFTTLTGNIGVDPYTGAVGNQYLNTFSPARGSTSISTYTYSAQRLNLPFFETATALAEIGNTIIIGTFSNILYPWDQVSVLPGNNIPLPENNTNFIITVNNSAYVFAGNKGNIYITNGSSAALSLKVPDYCAGVPGTPLSYIEPCFTWTAAMYCRGRVYFSILDQTSTKAGNCGGVWSFVPTQNFYIGQDTGQSLRLDNQNSYGTYNGAATVLLANKNQNAISPQYWSGWYSNISTPTYGIDYTDTIPEETTTIESDLIPTGTNLNQKTFSQIEYKLSSDLSVGEIITINYRQTGTDAWTSVGTAQTEGTTELSGLFPVNFQKGQWLQLQAILTPLASSSSSFCRLKQLRIR